LLKRFAAGNRQAGDFVALSTYVFQNIPHRHGASAIPFMGIRVKTIPAAQGAALQPDDIALARAVGGAALQYIVDA